ncbi:hypothetical protein A3H38_03535 [candidate division WOR-1 bacterium RIFCSPLOWO2_02_FULL_46_20]|uniref:Integrase catalytic domain-containing protein n=1 Tax=candidate division WOR-1 bacterium RIFCSPLOWO2_02_FULL_46_20 TaxID=1802567 RepID=A0A1F4RCN0_UNCSA|nr:MAG: hypothetical protein A3H38_03535 [candidate division WOR-1 bacterium RIFCSPLOWO2_02_FULL_46_20]
MQLHKRLASEQVKAVLGNYYKGLISVKEVLEFLGIGRSRFFALLQRYRKAPESFSITYARQGHKRISKQHEYKIRKELEADQKLIQDPKIPITTFNYSAICDNLSKGGIRVSVPTIIQRAKEYGCYQPKRERQVHAREVITTAIGALIQHDASHHLWSPYAERKWVLITSLDDYSRSLLYAELVESESTWAHIEAAREVMTTNGIPLQYYVDSLRVFRFVCHGESIWVPQYHKTDEVNPQWKQCVEAAGAKAIYALSPQAKGKIERPYRWLQDRIVRTCAREKITTIKDAREVLRYEEERYNKHQVHSTTGEIPVVRFARARESGQTFFRPLVIPKPYTSLADVFCLREVRQTDGYRKISLWNQVIQVPKVDPYEEVNIHIVPDRKSQAIGIRIWHENRLVLTTSYPRAIFPKVHF